MQLQSRKQLQLSPNCQAFPFVEQLITRNILYRINVIKQNRVTIIDCGVDVPGGWEAGALFASVCLGGLARVELHWSDIRGFRWPSIEVITDHPVRACLTSQYAGWPIKNEEKTILGSGPIRSLIHSGNVFKNVDYHDDSETAIICLESETLPTNETIETILEICKCDPKSLYILVAPTASLVGSVQVSARALETGLSKLMLLDYDLEKILSGWSTCLIPPIASNHFQALGRTNDAILYGSAVYFSVFDEDKNLEKLVNLIPSSLSTDYGQPFEKILQRCGNFYDLDPNIFSPAEVWFNNINSGHTFHAGAVNIDILFQSFNINYK